MIPLGRISIRGERGEDRMTRLTRDEQYTLMNLFCIFRSPLMFGGDLPSNDEFTLSLLTNEEVLKMHKESTEVRQLFQQDGKVGITSRNKNTGDIYLALFNLNDKGNAVIDIPLKDLGLNNNCLITDMWNNKSVEQKVTK